MAVIPVENLLADLVSIESVNPYFPGGVRGETAMSDYVASFAADAGLAVDKVDVVDGRPNVVAELRVPGATRTLLLDSHMDTVSLDQMGADGLRPVIANGRMTGRGSCDDKASLAAMLIAVSRLAANPAGLQSNVVLLASADEEYLMRGAGAFARSGRRIDGAIVGEPTNLDVVIAHKGVLRWQLHVHGKAAHSSNPQFGTNAIYQMAELLNAIRPEYEQVIATHSHPLLGSATWSVGKIWGGTAVNIVPELCTVEIDRRLLPGEDAASGLAEFDEILAKVRSNRPDLEVTRAEPFAYAAPVSTPATAPVVRAIAAACGAVRDRSPLVGVAYGTNASRFAEVGIECVVLGPGDIRQAHTADEYIDLNQVVQAAAIYEAAARAF
jgi:acetylornithine deacetylase